MSNPFSKKSKSKKDVSSNNGGSGSSASANSSKSSITSTDKTKLNENTTTTTTDNKVKRNPRADNRLNNYTWPDCVQPNGKAHWGEWRETNARAISIRSSDYLTTRAKTKSKRSLFKLAYQEFIEANLEESKHIATHENSWYKNNQGKLPKDTFHLIVSIQLQSIKIAIISYYVMRTEDSLYTNQESSSSKLLPGDNNKTDTATTTTTGSSPPGSTDVEPMTSNGTNSSLSELSTTRSTSNITTNVNNENLQLYNELMELQKTDEPNGDRKAEDEEKEEKKLGTEPDENGGGNETFSFIPKIHYGPLDTTVPLSELSKSDNSKKSSSKNNNNNNNNNNSGENNNTNMTSIWKLFLSNNHPFICDRLKLIPHIVKSPWYLPIPNKPVLLGKYSPSHTYRGENYLEVNIEADSTKLAQKVVKGAHGVSKQIVVDIVWVIEGCRASELPERCLGGVRLFNVDVTKVTPLKKWDDGAIPTTLPENANDAENDSDSELAEDQDGTVDRDEEIMGVD